MPDQIYIGNFSKGLKTGLEAFNIDNDAFPMMYNFYTWRGRAKRKRGTEFLGQLQRQIVSVAVPDFTLRPWEFGPLVLVAGSQNLIDPSVGWVTNTNSSYSLEPTSTITPGSIDVDVGGNNYTEPSPPDGTLLINGLPDPGSTINYTTGVITITGGGAGPLTGTFSYFPELPVMGLADFDLNLSEITNPTKSNIYPSLLAFDTKYSYQVNQAVLPVNFYNTTFYKNTNIPFVWSGEDFQLFWTTNYAGALWATNNKPGLNLLFGFFVAAAGPVVTFRFTTDSAGVTPFQNLIIGDVLWFNEWPGPNNSINGVTGTVTLIVNAATGTYQVTFSVAPAIVGLSGITQMLTNTLPGQDGIKWYDGDPTNTTGIPTVPSQNLGWVNFSPPLTGSASVSINNTPPKLYYLVGALAILPFKDRLLMFSPWIKASTDTLAIQLIDTVLWSWNGTPYYTVDNSLPTPLPVLVPVNQTANVKAWYVDQTGLGGYLPAGISQPIKTVSNNEDVLLIGFGGNGRKTRFAYTGNDLQPFLFFNINSELPSSSTFSAVTLDDGAIDIGQYGIAITDQQSSKRIDLDIPDNVFQIRALDNGANRVNALRDFFNEWIYFSYPLYGSQWKFPTQTFLFNYRDNTWAIFYENWTVHGNFRAQLKKTWQNLPYKSWDAWRTPWNSGSDSPLYVNLIAGNPQGYVLLLDQGTNEGKSGTIKAIANSGGVTQITSTNHCVKSGDFLFIDGALGILSSVITNITLGTTTLITTVNTFSINQSVVITNVAGTTQLNGNTYTILSATAGSLTIDVDSTSFNTYTSGGKVEFAFNKQIGKVGSTANANTFVIDLLFPLFNPPVSAYQGLGSYTRLSQPLIKTKQFPVYWNEGRQVRLGVQKYLFDVTQNSQVTVNIYLSQDPTDSWNDPLINVPPNSLVYSQVVYTCPESTNLGLTPANINLQTPIGENQNQIWHRMSTSLIGDSIQLGVTLSEAQMRNLTYATSEIVLHGIQLTVDRSSYLA